MGILRPDISDAERRLEAIDAYITKSANKTRRNVAKINRAINNGVLADISAAAGGQGALMLQVYNKMLDVVEGATGVRPTAFVGHAENPAE